MTKKEIIGYYDYTTPYYRDFWWENGESMAIHYGFWYKGTKSMNEALLNTNSFLAEKLGIGSSMSVLDAGCGVGGSSIWLAKHMGVKVTGISLSSMQIREAKRLARISSVSESTRFYVMDYLHTRFRSKSFDIVWAIESACHCDDKEEFLKEGYRLLRKGGRMAVCDGFLTGKLTNRRDRKTIDQFTRGLAVPNLASLKSFRRSMAMVGFRKIRFWDMTENILPSARKLYRMMLWAYPVSELAEKLHLLSPIMTRNNLAGLAQYRAFNEKLSTYGVFLGEK
ncbi:MAG: methyltransferase domain-containing protein [Candidatus Micrarchaeota archaeon]|nr:methyltransferase domain-containing protein [Candidatus Micrarchaeota archaeon]